MKMETGLELCESLGSLQMSMEALRLCANEEKLRRIAREAGLKTEDIHSLREFVVRILNPVVRAEDLKNDG